MKMTQRQERQISRMLNEDASQIRDLHGEMYARRRRSLMTDTVFGGGPTSDIAAAARVRLEQDFEAAGSALGAKFDRLIGETLSSLINTAGGQASGGTLLTELKHEDHDGLADARRELQSDVARALKKYLTEVATIAARHRLTGLDEG